MTPAAEPPTSQERVVRKLEEKLGRDDQCTTFRAAPDGLFSPHGILD